MRYDIRFSGSGGQGIITAGILTQYKASLTDQRQGVEPARQKLLSVMMK